MSSALVTRRRMLGLATAAAGLAGAALTGCGSNPGATASGRVTAPPPAGVLGVNVDQNLSATNFAELRAVWATWLRGFYPMQDADQGDVAGQQAMQKLLAAVSQGYGTVLNLKFDYPHGLPAAGSAELNVAFQRLDKVLAVVMGEVDILVVGNEPFYECGRKTANLNAFYEALAQHTIDYRNQRARTAGKTRIYLGALTDLEDSRSRNALTDRWLEFVRNTPSVAGTDCHPHVASLTDAQQYLDYIVPRLRPGQKFLATEFSLVKLYKQHLKDPVPTGFADSYRIPRGTLVWQFVREAIARPIPEREWNDFLLACPWFADTKQFLTDTVGNFRRTGRCAVAACALTQAAPMVQDFGPAKPPWVFNTLFCPRTVQPGADGVPGQNLTWTGEFRPLQQG
ncbi:hypothetical protein [Amycolatopsis alkalitolerans]|uniref:hypothetical protein n=1 Tax=Amycolatopsis alkalitolerans TaxID=2547244 RepID=UPI00190F84FF|nr:hypothetical protein [Amycolatopsis alkalitolerans]